MKYLLVLAFIAVSSAATVPEDKSLISSLTSGASAITSGASAISSALSGASSKCEPKPMNLTALQNVLPSNLAHLVTEENVSTLKNVGTLAQLATSAATGNPIAIVKLVMFLASPDDPIVPLYNLGKEIMPNLSPSEIASNFPSASSVSGAFSSATGAIGSQIQQAQQQLGQIFNKQ